MYSFLFFLITLSVRSWADNSTFDQDFEEVENLRRKALGNQSYQNAQIERYNQLCVHTDWSCVSSCRRSFEKYTDRCVLPKDDYCFDSLVTYNYTVEKTELFPFQLKILKLFPRCWNHLNPLLCGSHFRPCKIRKITFPWQRNTSRSEYWQVFPFYLCERARYSCEFLKDYNVNLEALNCDSPSDNPSGDRSLFDMKGRCKFRYDGFESSVMSADQCLSPLVRVHQDHKATFSRPIIDECHMPCTSSFVSDIDGLLTFRLILLLSTFSFSILFIFIIFCIYRESPLSHFHRYLLLNVFSFAVLFYGLWTLALLNHNSIENSAACEKAGTTFVRKEVKRGEIDWCLVQSSLLHFSFISSFTWFMIYIASHFISDAKESKVVCENGLDTKSLLFITITASSLSCALFGLWVRPTIMDGLTGVCSLTLGSVKESAAFYIPTVIILLTIVIYCISQNLGSDKKRKPLELWPVMMFSVAILTFVSSFVLHYFNNFNGSNERDQLVNKVKCVLEVTKTLKTQSINIDKEVSHCTLDSASVYNLLHIYLYTILLPAVPFVFLAVSVFSKGYQQKKEGKIALIKDSDETKLLEKSEESQNLNKEVERRNSRIFRESRRFKHRRRSMTLRSTSSLRSRTLPSRNPSLMSIKSNTLPRHVSVETSIDKSDTILSRQFYSTASSVFSMDIYNDNLPDYPLPPSRAKDFVDIRPESIRFTPNFKGRSPVLAFFTEFIKEAEFVERKQLYLQLSLHSFRDYFEKDVEFNQLCHAYRALYYDHPEVNNLDGCHLVSINQMIDISTTIADEEGLLRMARYCGLALLKALNDLSSQQSQ